MVPNGFLRQRRMVLCVVASFLIGAGFATVARAAENVMTLGATFRGMIYSPRDEDTIAFSALQGSHVTFVVKPMRREPVTPSFQITNDDTGQQVDLSQCLRKRRQIIIVRDWVVPATGRYVITVGTTGQPGKYEIISQVRFPRTVIRQRAELTENEAFDLYEFDAAAGSSLDISVRPDRRSTLRPGISVVDPLGRTVDLRGNLRAMRSGAVLVRRVQLPELGHYSVSIQRNDGAGKYRVSLRVMPPRIRRTFVAESTVGPRLLWSSIPSGKEDVEPNGLTIRLILSKEVDMAAVNASAVELTSRTGAAVPVSVGPGENARQLVITATEALDDSTEYHLRLTNALKDLDGNPASGDEIVFTTVDRTAPRVAAVRPADGSQNVSVSADVTVVFSEPVDASSVTKDTFKILKSDQKVDGALTVSDDGKTVVFHPSRHFLPGEIYRVVLTSGIRDRAGNSLVEYASSFMVTPLGPGPIVDAMTPADGSVDVPTDTTVVLHFSEEIDTTTVTTGDNGSFRVVAPDGTVVGGTIAWGAGNTQLTFTPSASLEAGPTTYTVIAETSILDTSGEPLDQDPNTPGNQRFVGTFTTVDETPPSVVKTDPSNGAREVSVNTAIVVYFSEAIDEATVTGKVALTDVSNGQSVSGTWILNAAKDVLTFTPDQQLLGGPTQYRFALAAGIKDLAGNDLPPTQIEFWTSADTQGPFVVSMDPSGPVGASLDTNIVLRFSEPLAAASVVAGTSLIVERASDGAAVAGTITFQSGGTVVVFNPTSDLDKNTEYRVRALTTITDRIGNPLDQDPNTAGAQAFEGTFTSGSKIAGPRVLSVVPADGATNVPLNANVAVIFSKQVLESTLTASSFVLQGPDGPVTGVITLDSSGTVATFDPVTDLDSSTTYTVRLTEAVTDVGGRPLDQDPKTTGNQEFTSSFTTIDTVGPQVVSITPADGADQVSLTTLIVVQFNEAIDPATLIPGADGTFRVSDLKGIVPEADGVIALSADGKVATYQPAKAFLDSDQVTVTLTSGIRDLAGNGLQNAPVQSSFRTEDRTGPRVLAIDPDGSVPVDRGRNIVLTFSEPVRTETVVNGVSLIVSSNDGQDVVSGRIVWNAEHTQLTFNPAVPLAPLTQYTVRVTTAVQDVYGNGFDQDQGVFGQQPFVSHFLTLLDSSAAPMIILADPKNNATDVVLNTSVSVVFSEAMDPDSVRDPQTGVPVIGPNGKPAFELTAGGATIPGTISFDASSTVATFVIDPTYDPDGAGPLPPGQLAPNTLHIVRVTDVAKDASGTPFDQDPKSAGNQEYRAAFTTGTELGPQVVGVNPADGATDVGLQTPITITFNKPIDPDTVTTTSIRLASPSGDVNCNRVMQSGDTEVVLIPTSQLFEQTSYEVLVSTDVTDKRGNHLVKPFRSTFRTIDLTGPSLVSSRAVTIENRENDFVEVVFSEPVIESDALTLANYDLQSPIGTKINLSDDVDGTPDSAITYDPNTYTVRITLDNTGAAADNLKTGNDYRLVVSNVRDLSGNRIATGTATTGVVTGDVTAPTVKSATQTLDPSGAVVDVVFSEDIDPVTATVPTNYTASGIGDGIDAIMMPDGRTVRVTFPSAIIPGGTTVSVRNVEDLAGNAITLILGVIIRPTIVPRIISIDPPIGPSTGGTKVTIRGNNFVYGARVFFGGVEGIRTEVRNVDQDKDAYTDTLIVITPRLPNPSVGPTPVDVMVVNPGGRSDTSRAPTPPDTSTGFTYQGDSEGPHVLSEAPVDGSFNAARDSRISVNMSESIDPSTVSGASFQLLQEDQNGAFTIAVPGTLAVENDGTRISLQPADLLDPLTNYQIVLTGALTDKAGNPLADAPFTAKFQTAAVEDSTLPQIVAVTPADGATNVPTGVSIVVTFSEPMAPGSITDDTFYLTEQGKAEHVPAFISLSAQNAVATLTPLEALESNTTYVLTISDNVEDVAGNGLDSAFTLTFKTANLNPYVVAMAVTPNPPGSGNFDTTPNTDVIVTFSKEIDPGTLDVSTTFVVRPQIGQLPDLPEFTPGRFTVTVDDQGRSVVTFSPSAMLFFGLAYVVRITPGVTDTTGVPLDQDPDTPGLQAYTDGFTVGFNSDTVRPTCNVDPNHNTSHDNATFRSISIQFSEPINRQTLRTYGKRIVFDPNVWSPVNPPDSNGREGVDEYPNWLTGFPPENPADPDRSYENDPTVFLTSHDIAWDSDGDGRPDTLAITTVPCILDVANDDMSVLLIPKETLPCLASNSKRYAVHVVGRLPGSTDPDYPHDGIGVEDRVGWDLRSFDDDNLNGIFESTETDLPVVVGTNAIDEQAAPYFYATGGFETQDNGFSINDFDEGMSGWIQWLPFHHLVPPYGFSLDLDFMEPDTNPLAGIDPTSLIVTCSDPLAGGHAFGGYDAGENFADEFSSTIQGRHGSFDLIVPERLAFPSKDGLTVTASVADYAGNRSREGTMTLDVAPYTDDVRPNERKRVWLISTKRDNYTITSEYENENTGDVNEDGDLDNDVIVRSVAAPNGISDFDEDLALLGLRSDESGPGAATVVNYGQTGTNAIIKYLVLTQMKQKVEQFFRLRTGGPNPRDPGRPNGIGQWLDIPVNISVFTDIDPDAPSVQNTTEPFSVVGVGGDDYENPTGTIDTAVNPPSGGASPAFLRAFPEYDQMNFRAAREVNLQINDGLKNDPEGTMNNLGVFLTNFIRFFINSPDLPNEPRDFRSTFDPFISGRGTPIGMGALDATILAPGFNPAGAPAQQVARYNAIMAAVDRLSSLLAVEATVCIGHGMGLVPGEGDNNALPPKGLFGGWSLINLGEPLTAPGSIDVPGNNMMTSTTTFLLATDWTMDFSIFTLSYLQGKVFYDERRP